MKAKGREEKGRSSCCITHHVIGGHQAAQDLREGPLRLQARVEVTQVKEQQRSLVGAGDPGAQRQHALHEVGHRRDPTQLPEHHHRRLQDTAQVASLNPTSPTSNHCSC